MAGFYGGGGDHSKFTLPLAFVLSSTIHFFYFTSIFSACISI